MDPDQLNHLMRQAGNTSLVGWLTAATLFAPIGFQRCSTFAGRLTWVALTLAFAAVWWRLAPWLLGSWVGGGPYGYHQIVWDWSGRFTMVAGLFMGLAMGALGWAIDRFPRRDGGGEHLMPWWGWLLGAMLITVTLEGIGAALV